MKKRILSTLLALCIVLGMSPGIAWALETEALAEIIDSGYCGGDSDGEEMFAENLTWVLDNTGTLTIGGSGPMKNFIREYDYNLREYRYLIPWWTYFYGATRPRDDIKKVILPEGLTTIGSYAFFLSSGLTSVTIPTSVTNIGYQAFCGCSNLTNVTIPVSVVTIGNDAFDGCSGLKDIYYSGSEADWAKISIGDNNDALTNATIHYNSTSPDDPGDGGLKLDDKNSNWTVTVGETLKVTAQMADGSTFNAEKLQWTLSDIGIAAIAEIVDSGWEGNTAYAILRGIKPGKTTLTATMPSMTSSGMIDTNPLRASQEITVIGQENICFDQDTYSVKEGETVTAMVSVPNPNGLTFSSINFNCTSSDSNVASVTSWKGPDIDNGLNPIPVTVGVKGLKTGTTTITASVSDGRSASCEIAVKPSGGPTGGYEVIIGNPYPISVEGTGRSYAPIPDVLKGEKFSWLWQSSNSGIVSFSDQGTLGEMSGEGNPSNTISVPFHARSIGTATLTCSINGNTIYSQEVIVKGPDSEQSTIESNDYNVPQDVLEKFEKDYNKVEVAYKQLMEGVQDVLDHPGKHMDVFVEPSIEEQAEAMLEHDSKSGKDGRYIYFLPGNGVSSSKVIPDELKKFCYQTLCLEIWQDAKEAKFSLKNISLNDPFQTDLIKEISRLFGNHTNKIDTYTDSQGNTIRVEIDVSFHNSIGTIKCYPDVDSDLIHYSGTIMPQYDDAEEMIKGYLDELIDLEYRAQKNARDVLMKEVIKFSLNDLIDFKLNEIKDKLRPTGLGLEALQLNGFDSTVEDCYNYGTEVKKLKELIERNPKDGDSIVKSLENLAGMEVPSPGKALARLVFRFNTARENFRLNILDMYDSGATSWFSKFQRRIFFNCPIGIKVYKDGQQIGYVGEDDIWYNNEIIIEANGPAKVIYCSPEDTLSFEIIGTDDGMMNYTIEDYDSDSPIGRLVSNTISVRKDQLFTGEFPGLSIEQNQGRFTLTSEGETIRPVEYIPVSESARVDIGATVVPANSGNVYGGGAYVRGDAVVLYVSPKAKYTFSGWYNNSGTLVSTSSIYEFSATEDCTLEARFAVNSDISDNPGSSVYLIAFDPNGGTISGPTAQTTDTNGKLPNLPSAYRNGHTFNGWYTSDGTRVTTDTIFDANTTVYAHWSYNGDGASSGGGSSSSGGGNSSGNSYSITAPSNVNGGTVRVSPNNTRKGATVTITVTPDTGYQLGKLTVTESKGNELKLTDKGDGKFTFTMPASKVSVNATFVKVEEIPTQPTTSFMDVSSSAYYADAVAWAVEKGITVGTSATMFSPGVPCTRAQIVTFLWRAAGSPVMSGNSPFTDVAPGSYYYDAVQWAVAQGITVGTSANTFSPDATCTRGQAVTFLYRYEKSPVVSGNNAFTDVSSDAYYANAVQWAVMEGVTSGTSAITFSPDAICTRSHIVTFLYRDMT